ncbi:MAG: DUF3098 domain-containing protein [Bacteroidota bacterium]
MAAKKPTRKGKSSPKKPIKKVKAVAKSQANKQVSPKAVKPVSSPSNVPNKEVVLPFTRMNYILLIVGVLIIGLGFFLMSLDEFVDATQFSISLYVAPIVVIVGFLEIIYAIMYKPAPVIKPTES